ncbi:hypothetical protein C8A00DRAFT_15936, partial [Chaetomidium leptoderma]
SASSPVVLSFSADVSSGGILFPERRITLSGDGDTITIGRASKVSTKGFIARLDNAWFDSPVMSRQHARLFFRMDPRKIEIKDLGSLHGTFLNDDIERVPTDGFRELKEGDTLRFGAPIWRGTEKFEPTTVKVGINFPEHSGTSTFKVPDGSDDDASEDDRSSDTDDSIKQIKSRSHAVQNSSARNAAVITPYVDLTTSNGGHQTRHIIDLSSPCPSPIRIDEDEADSIKVVSNENDKPENTADTQAAGAELGESVVHDGNLGDRTDMILDMEDRLSWYSSDGEGDATSLVLTDDESQIDYPDEGSESQAEAYDDAGSDDDMEDMDLEEGYTSDDSIDVDSPDGKILCLLDVTVADPSDHDHHYWDDLPHSVQVSEYPEIAPLIESLSRHTVPAPAFKADETVARNNAALSILGLLNPNEPQKPSSPPKTFRTTPSSPDSMRITAEVLGAKTGKMDFFLAREQNKKTLASRPTLSVHALCNNVDEPTSYKFGPAGPQNATLSESSPGLPRLFDPSLLCTPSPLISQPTETIRRADSDSCLASGDIALILGSPVSLVGEVDGCSQRTSMGTSDVARTGPHNPTEGTMKRKADDISDTTDEQDQWAAKAAQALSLDSSAVEEEQQTESSEEPTEPLEQVGEATSIATSPVPERPVKRARVMRAAERLGYAALGGVTAGAMIVGTLIYTAPTFG